MRRKVRIRPLFGSLLMFLNKRFVVGLHNLFHDKLLKLRLVGIEVVQNAIKVSPSLFVANIVDIRRVLDGSISVDVGL